MKYEKQDVVEYKYRTFALFSTTLDLENTKTYN